MYMFLESPVVHLAQTPPPSLVIASVHGPIVQASPPRLVAYLGQRGEGVARSRGGGQDTQHPLFLGPMPRSEVYSGSAAIGSRHSTTWIGNASDGFKRVELCRNQVPVINLLRHSSFASRPPSIKAHNSPKSGGTLPLTSSNIAFWTPSR